MKRFGMLMITLLFLGMSVPLRETTSVPTAISDREGLERIAEDPYGSYVLTADIDLKDNPWTPILFFGTFDGGGHTIGNMTVVETGKDTGKTYDGNDKIYDTVFAGLFSIAESANISHLTLLNAKIQIETNRNCFIGAIAGYTKNSTISDCTVLTRQHLTLSSVNAGIGGAVGFCENSQFNDCNIDAELIFEDINRDVLCEEFLAGVFSCGYGSVQGGSVVLRGYADVYGYAHNGGVIGMFKLSPEIRRATCSVREVTVNIEISFFEITRSRRAYCKPIIGEDAYKICRVSRNKENRFVRSESKDGVSQRPEKCDAPEYTITITNPSCTQWGYTTYTCSECGYSYCDDYTLPQHSYRTDSVAPTCDQDGSITYTCEICGDTYTEFIPSNGHSAGDWTVIKEAGVFDPGEEAKFCKYCDTILEKREIPAKGPKLVQSIRIPESEIRMMPGETACMIIQIEPIDATDNSVLYSSSDPEVAIVDEDGIVTAQNAGTATISIASADGNAETTCLVIVERKERTFSLLSFLRCAKDD